MRYIICILIIAILQIIPGLFKYQDYVYDKDKTEYDLAKAEYDSVTIINRNNVLDSLTNAWISTNDTVLRKIKKIKKTPEYGELGYYQKTGRMECEENYRGKLICEPEKQWVTTDYYISGYKKDTIWTEGYKTRDEWTKKASAFAKTEAIKIYPDFHEYNGHEFHYMIKSNSGLDNFLGFIYFVGMAFCFFGLMFNFWNWIESKYNGLWTLFGFFISIIALVSYVMVFIAIWSFLYK
jgi:hypothetical protein